MSLYDVYNTERELALQEWCDCDKRRIELGRPFYARQIEMKVAFIEFLMTTVYDPSPWIMKKLWGKILWFKKKS